MKDVKYLFVYFTKSFESMKHRKTLQVCKNALNNYQLAILTNLVVVVLTICTPGIENI